MLAGDDHGHRVGFQSRCQSGTARVLQVSFRLVGRNGDGRLEAELATFPLWRSGDTYLPLAATFGVPMREAGRTDRTDSGYDPADTPAEPNRRATNPSR